MSVWLAYSARFGSSTDQCAVSRYSGGAVVIVIASVVMRAAAYRAVTDQALQASRNPLAMAMPHERPSR